MKEKLIDVEKERYPHCVVWTPLPLVTALIPFVGHTGVGSTEGVIHDFSKSYTLNVDDLAFGTPTKYIYLELSQEEYAIWDRAVYEADEVFKNRSHTIISNNCHSHVAQVLNNVGYQGGGWNALNVGVLCVSHSKYVGVSGFIRTYIGFILAICVIWFLSSFNF
jgi:hypothetical protein